MFALTQVWHNIWQIVCCCLLLSMSMTIQHLRHFIRDLKITWVIWRDTSQTTTKMLLFSSWLWSHYLFFFLNQRSKKYYICVFFFTNKQEENVRCTKNSDLYLFSLFSIEQTTGIANTKALTQRILQWIPESFCVGYYYNSIVCVLYLYFILFMFAEIE